MSEIPIDQPGEPMPEWAKALLPGLSHSRRAVGNGALRARIVAVQAAHEGPKPLSAREFLAALVKAEPDAE
jgi:hypothetical protein